MALLKRSTDSAVLNVVARAPFQIYYEGPAQAVSAANRIGQFDVLPEHADFFSMLLPCEVSIIPTSGEPLKFNIANGIISVRDNEVLLFVNM